MSKENKENLEWNGTIDYTLIMSDNGSDINWIEELGIEYSINKTK